MAPDPLLSLVKHPGQLESGLQKVRFTSKPPAWVEKLLNDKCLPSQHIVEVKVKSMINVLHHSS